MTKVIVIGGGASGLVAAITAAKNGAEVTVLEKEEKTAKKLLVTGNGRCNLTNEEMDVSKYHGDRRFVQTVLQAFGYADTLQFFTDCGIVTQNRGGYIYPRSNQASTVAGRLRDVTLGLGVKIKTNNPVAQIQRTEDGFLVDVGILLSCDKLILATGSPAAPKTGGDDSGYRLAKSLGHTITPIVPALTGLICEPDALNKAAGVRTQARVTIAQPQRGENAPCTDTGELQITEYGISGIPVFNISFGAEKGTVVQIDFLPEMEMEQAEHLLTTLLHHAPNRSISQVLCGLLPDKLSTAILKKVAIAPNLPSEQLSTSKQAQLLQILKEYPLMVKRPRGLEYAQVVSGGVDTSQISPDTMASKLVQGLYFAGEIMDVDGMCGGYNLQFAWASGVIAGGSCTA